MYSRSRGYGIFHNARAYVGAVPTDGFDTMGMAKSSTALILGFEGTYLGLPSLYGNMHGIEGFATIRTGPNELNLGLGFPVTLLNVGRGQIGSFRIGGSFGAALGNIQAYGFVRGRVAMVLVPDLIDAEVIAQYTPSAASSAFGDHPGDFETITYRASIWYRYGASAKKSQRSAEFFIESFSRQREFATPSMDNPPLTPNREADVKGIGVGLGITLF